MTAKTLLGTAFLGALGLASLGIAGARSYDITLSSRAMAGSTELKPGVYKVKVEGSQAVFTDVESSKSWTAPVKIENSGTKFGATTMASETKGDMDHIQEIDLGGSNIRLEFGQ